MTATGYIHANADFESELRRLALLERRYDEGTFRRLKTRRSLVGARCLEVGAGAGSVARWLAGKVGRHGQVVATDIDPRFIADFDVPNLEVRRHDILLDDLEEASYDVAHCRALLLHLPDPGRALARMAAALRPGGLLLVEDADFVSMAAADPGHPLSSTFDRVISVALNHLESEGHLDPWFGRRLLGLVAGLGLETLEFETTVAVRRGGTPEAALHRQSMDRGRASMLAAKRLAESDFDVLLRATADPSFTFFDAVSVAAWGWRR